LKTLTNWGPVVAIMALIFFQSAMSDPFAPPGRLSDKTMHFLAYAALGGAMIRAVSDASSEAMTRNRVLLAWFVTALYGVSDEVHQAFVPGRTPDFLDLLADAAGAIVGAVVVAVVARGVRQLRGR
jgi:VanZ family protein